MTRVFPYFRERRHSAGWLGLNLIVWGYDEVGNKILQLDELGNPTYWAYDQASRVRAVRDALQNQTYFWHDAVGQVRVKIDAEGRTTYFGYYGYDASRRARAVSFSPYPGTGALEPSIYYTYDSVGNLTNVEDQTGSFGNVYDALDRLVTKTTLAGVVYYEFDKSSLKTKLVAPGGGTTYHYYDAAGLPTTIDHAEPGLPGIATTTFSHDKSLLIRTRALPFNQVQAEYTYDLAGRLETLNNRNAGGSVISYFTHWRDENGNPTVMTQKSGDPSGRNVYYAYDALDRLISEERKTGATLYYGWLYNYDAGSNRYFKFDEKASSNKTTYYVFDANNRMDREVNQ